MMMHGDRSTSAHENVFGTSNTERGTNDQQLSKPESLLKQSDAERTGQAGCVQLIIELTYIKPFSGHTYAQETSYELSKVGYSATYVHEGKRRDRSHEQSLCLGEGRYRFTLKDSAGNGFNGQYKLALGSGETIIARGSYDASGEGETTTFDVPFDPATVTTEPFTAVSPTNTPVSQVICFNLKARAMNLLLTL